MRLVHPGMAPWRFAAGATGSGWLWRPHPGAALIGHATLRKGTHMQIDKSQILELLRSQGKNDEASQAEGELPDQVDTDQHAGLLSKFGLEPADLIKLVSGGGGAGGLGGGLGGMLGGR